MNEAEQYDDNCFITLTYHDSALPKDYGLNKTDWRNFMNLLRKHYVPKNPNDSQKIRFFQSGEYGPETLRPHYHAAIFNWQPEDLKVFRETSQGTLYTSEILDWLWQFKGFATIGHLEFDSAAYVAGYVLNKQTGTRSKDEYRRTDDGETEWYVQPPYANMSRRPGIGKQWYDKYKGDLKKDYITYKGQKMKPPKFYDKLLEEEEPNTYKEVKAKRLAMAQEMEKDSYKLHSRSLIDKSKLNLRSPKL